jgi:hypothetical protein
LGWVQVGGAGAAESGRGHGELRGVLRADLEAGLADHVVVERDQPLSTVERLDVRHRRLVEVQRGAAGEGVRLVVRAGGGRQVRAHPGRGADRPRETAPRADVDRLVEHGGGGHWGTAGPG